MAFDKYKNGAWQEPEDSVYQYASSAWQECDFARRYISGAWTDIWTAIKWMSMLNCTFPSGTAGYTTSSQHDYKCWSMWIFDQRTNSAYATYYLDGTWTNPKISFSWEGEMNRFTSDGSLQTASAGTIQIYAVSSGGAATYTNAVTSIKGEGTYSTTLTGNYSRIGFKVTFQDWQVTDATYIIDMWNFTIDGKECLPSEDCVV